MISITWVQLAAFTSALMGAMVVVASALAYHVDKRFQHIDKRIDDLKDWIRAELKSLEQRLDRVEHPVTRP